MRYSTQIKPISYLKANAAEILNAMSQSLEPMIITKMVKQRRFSKV